MLKIKGCMIVIVLIIIMIIKQGRNIIIITINRNRIIKKFIRYRLKN